MLIRPCDLADPTELRAVHALQRAAYETEAALIGTRNIPGLRETPGQLAASAETFWGCFLPASRGCAGIIATEPEAGGLRISRLAVDPDHFRRGVGRALLAHVIAFSPALTLRATTGAMNPPGRRFYESTGFTLHGAHAAPDGTPIVEYRRPPA